MRITFAKTMPAAHHSRSLPRGQWPSGTFLPLLALIFAGAAPSLAVVYEVGEGTYTAIGQVPWESLAAGDTVLINWRSAPYQEKWVVCRRGISNAPITIRGVLERPVAGH